MTEPDRAFRRAYQAVLDRTPPAPDWSELGVAPAAPTPARARRGLPKWAAAVAAAALFGAVIGGASLFTFDGAGTDPVSDATGARAEPAPEEPGASGSAAVDPPAAAPELLGVARVAASSELAGFPARNLIDGTEAAWNDDSLAGAGARLTFVFPEPVELAEVVIRNLADPERFARNHKIHTFELHGIGGGPVHLAVPDEPGEHRLPVAGAASTVELVVTGIHPAEAFAGRPPFDELAVAEIEFHGAPAAPG